MRRGLLALMLALTAPALAQEQQPAKEPDPTLYPDAVEVAKATAGYRYVDRRGRTLYGLNPREARARKGTATEYCIGPCAELFTPLAAAAKAVDTGLWKPAETAAGRVWTYRGTTVYTFNADKPGAAGGDGHDFIFHALAYIPPKPEVVAPPAAEARFLAGKWTLTDREGRALFVRSDAVCGAACAPAEPFAAGLAERPLGEWTLLDGGDRRQWAWRGKPAFVASDTKAKLATGEQPITIGAK